MKTVVHEPSFDAWRLRARQCLAESVVPSDVHFQSAENAQTHLFGGEPLAASASPAHTTPTPSPVSRLPRRFVVDAQSAAVHTDPARWDLMYRLIWRLTHGEPELLGIATDDDVLGFVRLCKAVHRDVHKCHAYVRFRAVPDETAPGGKHWIAWYRPDYRVLPLAAPHFVERFGDVAWSIHTPDASVTHREGQTLFGPGCPREPLASADALEQLWHTYYVNIFNPARLNRRAMLQEMPQRYWKTMSETHLIDGLIKDAPKRTQAFIDAQPPKASPQAEYQDLSALHAAARACSICEWCAQSTQVVVGEGGVDARVVFVGEQPGDQEDLAGRPFVGPAGKLLDSALERAGIKRTDVFVTNAVKHFKWTPRGKRRLHQKPSATDVAACRPWLAQELRLVRPEWLVCLGTTAALSVLGKAVRLKDVRGQVLTTPACPQTICTAHPSAILRTPPEAQDAAFEALVSDLKRVASAMAASRAKPAP